MNHERRRAILDAATRDAELIAMITPVVAAGFGVVPLRRLGDVLTVACLPRANRQALRLLRDVLGLEVVATPMEEHLVREAIESAYFSDDGPVNFPTFRGADFLEDAMSAAVLREEKVERPSVGGCELEGDALVLATLTFRTCLKNLDLPSTGGALPARDRTQVHLGELELPYRQGPAGPEVYRPKSELPAGTRLVLAQYRFSTYRHLPHGARVDDHNVSGDCVSRFPHVIHPTEVQITGLTRTGALRFHLYDHERVCEPARPERLSLDYHFLSYGNRMHREIQIDVHEVSLVERGLLDLREGACPWGDVELGRWLSDSSPGGSA